MKREQSLGLKERAERAMEHERNKAGLVAVERPVSAAAAPLHGEPMGDGRVRLVDAAGHCWGIAAGAEIADRTERFFE